MVRVEALTLFKTGMLRPVAIVAKFNSFITRSFVSQIGILYRTGETVENIEKKKPSKME